MEISPKYAKYFGELPPHDNAPIRRAARGLELCGKLNLEFLYNVSRMKR